MKQLRKQPQKAERLWDFIFGAFLIIQILLWGWLNLHYQFVNDHDSAKVLYHTMRMWEEKTLLIPGWKYMTTAEWDCSALPALLFYGMTGNILLSFAIANIIHVFCFSLILLRLFKNLGLRGRYAYLTVSVVLVPLELGMLSYANMLFYGAAQYIYKTLVPLWMLELLTSPYRSWRRAGWILEMLAFCAMTFLTTVSSGLYVFLCGLFPVMACSAIFILRDEQIRQHGQKIAVCSAAFSMTLLGYVLQKTLGLSTYADALNVVLLNQFFSHLAENLTHLFSLTRALPQQETSLYTLGGIMYVVRFSFFICMLFLGLQGLKGWFAKDALCESQKKHDLLRYAGAALSGIFVWNLFIQQITVTSARYHLIGYVPLMIAAGIIFAASTQKQQPFIQFIRFSCAAGALTMMMAGCWSSAFSFAGNYHKDYHHAVTEIAQAQGADSIVFINDSASAEMARVFDPERVSVSYFTTNRSLVNYDAYDYYDDRSALTDKHLLVATYLGGLSNIPPYLQDEYTKVGEAFGDTVYMADNCWLDGKAGPLRNRIAIDYPFTQGYRFDLSMSERGIFPSGEKRVVMQSPDFESNSSAIQITLHYRAKESVEGAWLDVNIFEESSKQIALNPEEEQIVFEIPARKAFSFCVSVGHETELYIDRIVYECL